MADQHPDYFTPESEFHADYFTPIQEPPKQDFMGPQLPVNNEAILPPKLPAETPQEKPESWLGGIARRFISGPTDEEVGGHLARPMSEGFLPKMEHPADEGWLGYLARGAYNTLIQPLGSSEGLLQAGVPGKAGVVNRLEAGAKPPVPAPEVPTTPQGRLLQAVQESKPLTKEQARIYAQERSQKLSKLEALDTTSGTQWADEAMKAIAGEHTKLTREPLKLDQNDVDGLLKQIATTPAQIGFDKIHALTGFNRLVNGEVPRNFEIASLEKVFGPELTKAATSGKMEAVSKIINSPRKLEATLDMSAPLRQGLGLIHKKEFWTAIPDMFKSWGSQEAYDAVKAGIESRPTFPLMQDSKLALTDFGLTSKEEHVIDSMIDWLPGVKRSDRAYMAFLNKLRADTFDSLVTNATKAGIDVEHNQQFTRTLADFVNNATGRGSLGSQERNAVLLNDLMFSPRLIASRVRMLNPNNYLQIGSGLAPEEAAMMRKEYLKSLFAIAGVGTTLGQVAQLSGVASVEGNPTSSDFGKIKIGNTRLDPFGGFQQYITLASKLMANESTSTRTGITKEFGQNAMSPTRLSTLGTFLEQKANPVVSFATGFLRGKDATGQPFHVPEQVAQRFIPMMIQDVYDLAKEDPALLPLAIPGAFGMGVQTYR